MQSTAAMRLAAESFREGVFMRDALVESHLSNDGKTGAGAGQPGGTHQRT